MSQQIVIPEVLTKEGITTLQNNLIEKVREGEENPLHVLVKLRFMSKVIEGAEAEIKKIATEEASKLNKGGDTVSGAEVTFSEGRRTFDYSNDSVWCELKEKIKEREEMLKGLKKEVADTDTGEIMAPPITKYSAEIITVKFK